MPLDKLGAGKHVTRDWRKIDELVDFVNAMEQEMKALRAELAQRVTLDQARNAGLPVQG